MNLQIREKYTLEKSSKKSLIGLQWASLIFYAFAKILVDTLNLDKPGPRFLS